MAKKKTEEVSIIPQERVEIMFDAAVETFLPHTAVEMTAALPTDRAGCMKLLICNSVSACRYNSMRKWHIGRIISELDARGEEKVMEEAAKLTGYKTRELQHSIKLYKDYPNVLDVINLASVGLEMIQFKQLGTIRNPESRKQLTEKVLEGKLSKDDLAKSVDSVVAKEKAAKKSEKDAEADPDAPPAEEEVPKPNYKSLYARTEELMLLFIKNLQNYEKEHTDMLEWIGDPQRVPAEEFDAAMAIFEDKVEKPMEKALKELNATVKVLKTKADEQVERGKVATAAAKKG